jgi:hypothetical protein
MYKIRYINNMICRYKYPVIDPALNFKRVYVKIVNFFVENMGEKMHVLNC